MPFTVKALQKTGPDQPFRVTEIERRDPRPNDVVLSLIHISEPTRPY